MDIITCHYNPCGYENMRKNYWTFRENLGRPLITVELSFNGKFEIPDAIHIKGAEKNLMWQKERMLNLAIERSTADVVAWVDADLIWRNKSWYEDTLRLLETKTWVQLFEGVQYLDEKGRNSKYMEGFANFLENNTQHRQPGGAWACRRGLLAEGLYDANIIGGADQVMAYCVNGQWDGFMWTRMNNAQVRHALEWAAKIYDGFDRKIGYVKGIVDHLYHGTRKNRNYVNRWKKLTDHDFDPAKDIRIGRNGLYEWCTEKPIMHKRVRNYFLERKEDE